MGLQDQFTRFLAVTAALALAGGAGAADVFDDDQLADLSLDQLMGITVTSASKKEQNANEVPSAIFVLTQEDIRRSGATSIPEVLRLVPGVSVARANSGQWAVSARGFSGRFASKLLVLIDGRSVYTPLFSGTYWDVQDTMLEDIDRIEVIRGPGATVWGANAVNGVINIITKDSSETQGLLTSATAGNEEAIGGARWGGKVGDDFSYRGFVKYLDRDAGETDGGWDAADGMDVARVGFRSDWNVTDKDKVTFQADFYDGDTGMRFEGLQNVAGYAPVVDRDQEIQGGNVLARWTHTFSETMDASVQLYYDRTERFGAILGEERDTMDIEFQHRFSLPFNNEVIWGGGYRYTQDDISNTFGAAMLPSERHDDTFNFFVQDEIRFFEDMVRLTMGTKIEKNDYTNWEVQPSVRMAVVPTENHTFWTSVSRAVRVPSRAEDDVRINSVVIPAIPFTGLGIIHPLLGIDCDTIPGFTGCPSTLVQAVGGDNPIPERVYAFEAGWRAQFLERITLDVATFYNDYNHLISVDPAGTAGVPFGPSWTVFSSLGNGSKIRTHGVEVDLRTDVLEWWRVIVGYTYLHHRGGSNAPSHQGVVRSQMDLPFDLELDTTLYLTGNITSPGGGLTAEGTVPSYERLDLRLGWRPTEKLEISLVGQNLTDSRHPEFLNEIGIHPSQVQRAFYGKVNFAY